MAHYTAVVYATGAQTDKSLGIPGEDLPGSRPATEFVAWYNGHPDYRGLEFDLSTPVRRGHRERQRRGGRDARAHPQHQRARAHGRGRPRTRGAAREPDRAGRRARPAGSRPGGVHELRAARARAHGGRRGRGAVRRGRARRGVARVAGEEGTFTARKNVQVLQEFAGRPAESLGGRRISCASCAPRWRSAATGGSRRSTSAATSSCARMTARCGRVPWTSRWRRSSAAWSCARSATGPCRCPTCPSTSGTSCCPTTAAGCGRPTAEPLPGVYAVGWIKRGPTGILGTNKRDAEETIGCLSEDLQAGALPQPARPRREDVDALLAQRSPDLVTVDGWRAIDEHERERGRSSCARGSSWPRATSCSPRPERAPAAPEPRSIRWRRSPRT